jgi:dTDP-4-dehydrorhamnose reductase
MSDFWWVIGKTGQLARALACEFEKNKIAYHCSDRNELDLADPALSMERLTQASPQGRICGVILCAAHTAVDRAEQERELAFRVNAGAPGLIAQFCAQNRIPLLHFSTDYVFDGSGQHARNEQEPTSPQSVYGESKREGERLVLASGARAWIFRVSWLYDATGKNFFRTMLNLRSSPARQAQGLSVIDDQVGAPTYVPVLAQALAGQLPRFLDPKTPTGIFHLAPTGEVSWKGFAEQIFERVLGPPIAVRAVSTEEYLKLVPNQAHRPRNSRLDSSHAKQVLGLDLGDWSRGLDDCVRDFGSLET